MLDSVHKAASGRCAVDPSSSSAIVAYSGVAPSWPHGVVGARDLVAAVGAEG
eukprot:CAMPEP_0119374864 /NCGR_PEP_ID=MMETSP1334-20130426/33387_1 /TAXON_ID=127549 /ORGANISM="Calcidiscus leptoporus, Strain RCC1130" /LENGTH=51 /DNA_ID=CAMNT_0007393045 /DNA_START=141 /DNA_END=292 /DNA_ORIENTATION=-